MPVDRIELLTHVDWIIRPPAWFYTQLEDAIELAAEGRVDEMAELDCRRYRVREVIEDWDLGEFVRRFDAIPRPEEDWDSY